MNTGMSHARRRLLALANLPKYRDGGPVRGPGTGTSDEVLDEVRPGSYIVPADSTRKVGPRTLADVAKNLMPEADDGQRIPVRLSNGEYKLSPEQVHAIGVRALDQMKDATHKPAGPPSRQSVRERLLRLADGGMVNEVTRTGNSYSGGNVAGNISVNGQAPGGTFSQISAGTAPAPAAAPAPSAAAPVPVAAATAAAGTAAAPAPAAQMGWAERNAQRSLQVTASSMMPSAERDAAQSQLKSMSQPAAPAAAAAPAAPSPAATAASTGWSDRNAGRSADVSASSITRNGWMKGGPSTGAADDAPAAAPSPDEPPPPVPQIMTPNIQTGAPGTAFQGRPASALGRPAGYGEPRRYADGGLVDDERQRLIAQIPTGGQQAPAADGSQDRWSNTETGRNIVNAAAAVPGVASAVPAVVRTGGAISSGLNAASRLLNVGAAFAGAATPSPAAAAAPSTTGAGRGSVNPPMVNPDAPPPAQPPVSQQANLSSAGALGAGDAAAYAPPARPSVRERLLAIGDDMPAAVQPTPVIRHSGNDWAARNALRNAEVSASSITNRAEWNNAGKADADGKIARYNAAVANDFAVQQAQPGLEQEGMRQRGLSARERLLQIGENARANLSAQRYDDANQIAAGELGLKQAMAGFQNRAAQRMENAQVAYEQAATPAQRAAARDRLLALAGKTRDDQWKAVALQGGTDAMGNKTESILGAVNERTGEMRRMDSGKATPPAKDALVKGQVYQTARGPAVWDGTQFRAQ